MSHLGEYKLILNSIKLLKSVTLKVFRGEQCLDFQMILEYVSTAPTEWGRE